jgi:hypothetical protein
MVGEEEDFLEAMRLFREWAIEVATLYHNPDWAVPTSEDEGHGFAFSLEAYNYFAAHTDRKFRSFESVEELFRKLEKHSKHLYNGETAIMFRDSELFVLPDKVLQVTAAHRI